MKEPAYNYLQQLLLNEEQARKKAEKEDKDILKRLRLSNAELYELSSHALHVAQDNDWQYEDS